MGVEAGNRRKARPDVEPQAEGFTRHLVGNLEPVPSKQKRCDPSHALEKLIR